MTEKEQIACVRKNWGAIHDIILNGIIPSEAVQLAAVQYSAYSIRWIENSSEEVQLVAVTKNGEVILYIKNPSEAVQLAAVTQDGWAIRYIKNPSDRVKIVAELCKVYS